MYCQLSQVCSCSFSLFCSILRVFESVSVIVFCYSFTFLKLLGGSRLSKFLWGQDCQYETFPIEMAQLFIIFSCFFYGPEGAASFKWLASDYQHTCLISLTLVWWDINISKLESMITCEACSFCIHSVTITPPNKHFFSGVVWNTFSSNLFVTPAFLSYL